MTTYQEVKTTITGFLTQWRGIFPGFEKILDYLDGLEQREQAMAAKEAQWASRDSALLEKEWKSGELDQRIAAKTAELSHITEIVAAKLQDEEDRQRAAIAAKLEPLHAEHAAVTKQLDDKLAVLTALRT